MQADRTDGRSGILNRVAFTVPEGEFDLNSVNLGFRAEFADILHDVASQGTLHTAFGIKVAAPRPRCDRGVGSFTWWSVDNLRGDRASPRQTVVSLERPTDPGPAVRITASRSFSNSLVGRDVPTTGPQEPAMRVNPASTLLPGSRKGIPLVCRGGQFPSRTPRSGPGPAQHSRTTGSSI